jgi:ferredoxin-NADP reductase
VRGRRQRHHAHPVDRQDRARGEPGSRITLLYGNRNAASTMFKEELEDLKNRHLTRLALHPVFSREQVDSPLNAGRLDRAKMAEFLRLIGPATVDEAFVCGPHGFNDEVEAALPRPGCPPHASTSSASACRRPPTTPGCMRRAKATPPPPASAWCVTG